MLTQPKPIRKLYGQPEVALSRYILLYSLALGWIVLGMFLLARAVWPSSCDPAGLVAMYRCSVELPVNRGWVEAALLTWLWATPLLIGLELARRFSRGRR